MMQFKKLEFKNKDGQTLSARLDLPLDGKPLAYALFAHCFTCSKNIKAIAHISRALTREGLAVLRFDFTGLGESEGDFADTNFSSNVDDLIAAADFLESNYEAPKILIGHSFGGAAVLQAAGRVSASAAVVTIAAPADPRHVKHALGSVTEAIQSRGEADVNLAGRTFTLKKQFLDDLEFVNMKATLQNLSRALLVLHSPIDETVGIENAAHIFQAARHPKSFISLDKADHLLSDPEDSLYAGSVIAAWALKYVSGSQKAEPESDKTDTQVIARIGKSGYATDIMAEGHSLVADEPISMGGSGLGPAPYNYLLSGLGACTAITLRMYSDRKQWPLDGVTVKLNHQKIHAADCEICETKEGKLDQIEREIELAGPLDDQQKQRLMQIADRCPVHRTLHSEIIVKSKLKA
ncbi:MAG: alpha/beta fold hydrolase [Desulfobacterales bacterium]|jgi:putative redox protein